MIRRHAVSMSAATMYGRGTAPIAVRAESLKASSSFINVAHKPFTRKIDPCFLGFSKNAQPGRLGTTTSNASSARPPNAAGSVSRGINL